MEHYDFIALGGGNAGLTASKRVKAAGKKVALIDPTPVGGLCSLNGCNPKKVLVRAVEVLHLVREAGEHGIRTGEAKIDWSAVIDRKHRFTDSVTDNTEKGLRAAKVDYIKAPARFTAPDRLEVNGRALAFDGVIVATGSAPRCLSFPGADLVATSDQILEARTVPSRLAIIGAGAVALEFAHVFARLGSNVHVLNRGQEALKGHDRELVSRLVSHLQSLGVVFHNGVEVKAVEANPTSYDVQLSDGVKVGADLVLNAAGRPANLEGLCLEKAQVQYSEHGVDVNECLRSPGNPRIFAAGDAHGARELSPVASYEGAIVAHNFLHGEERRVDYSAIPSAIFTVPPLGCSRFDRGWGAQTGPRCRSCHARHVGVDRFPHCRGEAFIRQSDQRKKQRPHRGRASLRPGG